jgi:hypothetical protein
MQQGRVITDDDWNENERIENEDRRRTRVDIIGPARSPDNGFRICPPKSVNGQIDFEIEAGTFYLGGLRLQIEKIEGKNHTYSNQTYRNQTDWLQGPDVAVPASDRVDLVYLEAFQEPVSAVEDRELLEVALGGPDTSTRIRTFQRVHLLKLPNGDLDCAGAWEELRKKLPGKLLETGELEADAKLTVTFKDDGTPDGLCSPAIAGGYLGAENQAIRVQLVDISNLTWGFDNAAPLYRVKVGSDRQTVTMDTEPKDEAHTPVAGQVVEILPPGAKLPNGQMLAEMTGTLAKVTASYDPDTGKLTVGLAIPTPTKPGDYCFMRVWDQGSDTASQKEIHFTPQASVDLGHTGLAVTLSGSDFNPGDYWIIAARPETPKKVVPWDLESGRLPHGVRRFYAPLAVIHWKFNKNSFDPANSRVYDCRPTFRPLTQLKTCCTLTVGDGKVSHGDFDSLEEALNQLPASGGQICLLPGEHIANIALKGLKKIRISGCEGRTVVKTGTSPPEIQQSIFYIEDCKDITLESMELRASETPIIIEGGARIEITRNKIWAYRYAIQVLKNGADIQIHHNVIRMLDREGGQVAISMLAEGGLIERNDISVVPDETVPSPIPGAVEIPSPSDPCTNLRAFLSDNLYLGAYFEHVWTYNPIIDPPTKPLKTLGGIQIQSGSERITISKNLINGGAGNGITLGSDFDLADLRSSEEKSDEVASQIDSKGQEIVARVMYEGRPSVNTTLMLVGKGTRRPLMGITGKGGWLKISNAECTTYQVFSSDPPYQIKKIESKKEGYFQIHLASGAPLSELSPVLDPIYDIRITENEISNMGLSGIGVPQVQLDKLDNVLDLRKLSASYASWAVMFKLARDFGVLNGFTVNLTIQGNSIHDCLQNPVSRSGKAAVIERGVGGISLSLCENLRINENRIENNGIKQPSPVCGIFVLLACQVEITHNHVLGNGSAIAPGDSLQLGVWGGIVVFVATSLVKSRGGDHAARIYDNVVSQPVGRSLTMGAIGPVSVVNNRLNTHSASAGDIDTLVGAVLILNLGSLDDLGKAIRAIRVLLIGRQQIEKMQKILSAPSCFPSGNTIFSNNQTQLGIGQTQLGIGQKCAIAQLVATAGDLGFHGNQSDMLAESQKAGQVNSILCGLTLRASQNRFTEIIDAEDGVPRGSLLTISLLMNNTVDNQGNHCTAAVNLFPPQKRKFRDNQALLVGENVCIDAQEKLSAPKELVKALLVLVRRT